MTYLSRSARDCLTAPSPIALYDETGLTYRAMRTKVGLTREQAARQLTIPLSRLYDWEEGYSQPPHTEELRMYQLYRRLLEGQQGAEPT